MSSAAHGTIKFGDLDFSSSKSAQSVVDEALLRASRAPSMADLNVAPFKPRKLKRRAAKQIDKSERHVEEKKSIRKKKSSKSTVADGKAHVDELRVGATVRAVVASQGSTRHDINGLTALAMSKGDRLTVLALPEHSLFWTLRNEATHQVGLALWNEFEAIDDNNNDDNNPQTKTTKQESARDLAARELCESEQSHVDGLRVLVDCYVVPLRAAKSEILSAREIDEVFGNAEVLLATHSAFLADLRKRLASWSESSTLGDLLEVAMPLFRVGHAFADRHVDATAKAAQLVTTRKSFQRFCADLAASGDAQAARPLASLLVLPAQRLPRYRLLVQALRNATPAEHADHALLDRALAACDAMLARAGDARRDAEMRTRMLELAERLGHDGDHIVLPHRALLGEYSVRTTDSYGRGERAQLLLFDDMFVLAKPKKQLLRPDALRLRKRISLARCRIPALTLKEATDIGLVLEFGKSFERQLVVFHKSPATLCELQMAMSGAAHARRKWLAEKFPDGGAPLEIEFDKDDDDSLAQNAQRRLLRDTSRALVSASSSAAASVTDSSAGGGDNNNDADDDDESTSSTSSSSTDGLPWFRRSSRSAAAKQQALLSSAASATSGARSLASSSASAAASAADLLPFRNVELPPNVAVAFVFGNVGETTPVLMEAAASGGDAWRVASSLAELTAALPLRAETRLLVLNGFPRTLEQVRQFESTVTRPVRVVVLESGGGGGERTPERAQLDLLVNAYDGMMSTDGGPLLQVLRGLSAFSPRNLTAALLGDSRSAGELSRAQQQQQQQQQRADYANVPDDDDLPAYSELVDEEEADHAPLPPLPSLPLSRDISRRASVVLPDLQPPPMPPTLTPTSATMSLQQQPPPPPPAYSLVVRDALVAKVLPPQYDFKAVVSLPHYVGAMDRTDVFMLLRSSAPRTAVFRLADHRDRVEIAALMLDNEAANSRSGRALAFLPVMSTHEGGGAELSNGEAAKFFVPSMPWLTADSIAALLGALRMQAFVPRQFHQFALGSGKATECLWCHRAITGTFCKCRQCFREVHVACAPLSAFAVCVGRALSPAERRVRMVRRVFETLDVDGAGYLDRAEVMRLFAMSAADVDRLFAFGDENNDDKLEFEEFNRLVEERFVDAWLRCDVDDDGTISVDELQRGLQHVGKIPADAVQRYAERLRASGIATIDFREFIFAFFMHLSI